MVMKWRKFTAWEWKAARNAVNKSEGNSPFHGRKHIKDGIVTENRRNLFITIVSTAGCNENSPVFHMIYESILFINAPTVFSL